MTTPLVLATVKGVELARAGTWNGLTGPVTLTPEDLQDAVRAYEDREVDHAAVKLGHIDPRFDGQPAAGWVERLRLSEDGRTLLGDLVDMPSKLAAILPAAFRRRSVELRRGLVTPSGKRYRAVLSGLALLGVQAPAVKGLADVLEQYASDGTPGMDDDATHDRVDTIAMSDGDTPTIPHPAGAAGDAGNNPAPDGADDTREDGTMDPQTKAHLVTVLGLKPDATDAEVQAELAAQAENATTERENTDTTAGTDAGKLPQAGAESTTETTGTTAAPAAGQTAEGQAPAALSDGMVSVPRETWDALRADVARLTRAEHDREADAMLSDALQSGRIGPAEMDTWRKQLDNTATRAGAAAMLSELPARYPVTMLGSAVAPEATPDTSTWDADADRVGL